MSRVPCKNFARGTPSISSDTPYANTVILPPPTSFSPTHPHHIMTTSFFPMPLPLGYGLSNKVLQDGACSLPTLWCGMRPHILSPLYGLVCMVSPKYYLRRTPLNSSSPPHGGHVPSPYGLWINFARGSSSWDRASSWDNTLVLLPPTPVSITFPCPIAIFSLLPLNVGRGGGALASFLSGVHPMKTELSLGT